MYVEGIHGRSLDSACSSRRLADGRVTPELRVSPPPPSPVDPPGSPRPHSSKVYFSYMNKYSSPSTSSKETPSLKRSSSGCSHGRQFGLQRQEPIEETLFPPHYPTLVEEQEEDPGVLVADSGNITVSNTTAIIASPPTDTASYGSAQLMHENELTKRVNRIRSIPLITEDNEVVHHDTQV